MVKKRLLYISFLSILICGLASIISYTEELNYILAAFVIFFSLVWVYKCWNNIYLLVVSLFILYSNYSIVVGIYFDKSLRPMYLYPQITDIDVYGIGVIMLLLFSMCLAVITPKVEEDTKQFRSQLIKKKNYNIILFLILWLIFNLIVVFGFSRNTGTRGVSSPVYEYNAIVLLLLFYFSGDRMFPRIMCIECILVYSLTSIIGGSRIEALICIIIFSLCFFKKPLNQKLICFGMLSGLILFSIIGTIRGNWALLNSDSYQIIGLIFQNKFVFDTCTHAYFPMLCMIEMFKDYSFSTSLHYLISFIGSIFIGQSRVVDGDLIMVTAEKYYHNFGGVTLGFFFVWFHLLGSYIMSMFIYSFEKILIKYRTGISDFKIFILIYFIATVPRWYLYGPWSMTRGILVCLVVFVFFKKISNILMRCAE